MTPFEKLMAANHHLVVAGHHLTAEMKKKVLAVANAYLQPLQANTVQHQRNRKAEALLVRNRGMAAKPAQPAKFYNGAQELKINSGGMEAVALRSPKTDAINSNGTNPTEHNFTFGRRTFDTKFQGEPWHRSYFEKPQRHLAPEQRNLRNANISWQQGELMGQLNPGDYIGAMPIESETGSGRNPRARIYDRATNGALKMDDNGQITTKYLGNNRWKNNQGQVKTFNPADLKKPLETLAAGAILRRLAQHPIAQAAINVDEIVGGVTGKRPSEKIGEEYKKTTAKSIEERLKRGERVFNPLPMPF